MNKYFIFLLSLFILPNALAQTLYVTNTNSAIMRADPSPNSPVMTLLASNTPVQFVNTNKSASYTLVKTNKDVEGWVQTQYLQANQNPATTAHITQVVKSLKNQISALDKATPPPSIQPAIASLGTEALPQKLSLNKLEKQITKLDKKETSLAQKIINTNSKSSWFFIGVFTLLIGFCLGLVAPRLLASRKQRRLWS